MTRGAQGTGTVGHPVLRNCTPIQASLAVTSLERFSNSLAPYEGYECKHPHGTYSTQQVPNLRTSRANPQSGIPKFKHPLTRSADGKEKKSKCELGRGAPRGLEAIDRVRRAADPTYDNVRILDMTPLSSIHPQP